MACILNQGFPHEVFSLGKWDGSDGRFNVLVFLQKGMDGGMHFALEQVQEVGLFLEYPDARRPNDVPPATVPSHVLVLFYESGDFKALTTTHEGLTCNGNNFDIYSEKTTPADKGTVRNVSMFCDTGRLTHLMQHRQQVPDQTN
jgi:hypothetical protein